ncbi:MAG: ATP synthase F1 subunit gamma [Candidatus Curtissbacteria bacterium]
MATIRDIRKRIKSVQNTQKVTHAMELVAAAKMRRSQQTALAGRPYSHTLHEILSKVQSASHEKQHRLLKPNDSPNQLILVISSDRGLAGGLNLNVFREILKSDTKNASFITIGKKATQFVAKTGMNLIASYESEEIGALELARLLTKMASDDFLAKKYSRVSAIYPHFESVVKQNPKWLQLLPIPPLSELEDTPPAGDFLFEPDADLILDSILRHHVLTQIYQVLVETKASEHSARMVAMKNATDAAGDLVDDLTLVYNQARQEAITKELLDIITAQHAFE